MIDLYTPFNDIIYYDKEHKYFRNDEELISVTTFIKKLRKPFNNSLWSHYTAFKESGYNVKFKGSYFTVNDERFDYMYDSIIPFDLKVTPDDISEKWKLKGMLGTSRGSIFHNYMEHLWKHQIYGTVYPQSIMEMDSASIVAFHNSIEDLKKLGKSFYIELSKTRIPVVMEHTVATKTIAGTFDMLCYNLETKEFELWDYKSDLKIEYKNNYGNKIEKFNVDDCEFNKYGIQLSIYKYILEKHCDIKISNCFIAHFSYTENNYNIIKTDDYSESVKNIIDVNNSPAYF